MGAASMIKRVLLGRPLATAEEMQERLSKKLALPVFSSDAISSTAYATEEILLALVLAGAMALHYSFYISVGVAFLLVIVALSYQQTVHAYPSGGGSYIVSRENLGLDPGHGGRRLADGRLRHDRRREHGLRSGGPHLRRSPLSTATG